MDIYSCSKVAWTGAWVSFIITQRGEGLLPAGKDLKCMQRESDSGTCFWRLSWILLQKWETILCRNRGVSNDKIWEISSYIYLFILQQCVDLLPCPLHGGASRCPWGLGWMCSSPGNFVFPLKGEWMHCQWGAASK